jgi:nucleotide-binding universal stress UspA family protein
MWINPRLPAQRTMRVPDNVARFAMKIAVAIDGSPCALRALKAAIDLAEKFRKPPGLTLVVVDWSVPVLLASRMGEKNVGAYHEKNLREYGKKARTLLHRKRLEFHESTHIAEEPSLGLLEYLGEHRCDLLVMGSHGRGAVRGALMGSVTAKMLVHSRVPILIVRQPGHDAR